MTTTNTTNILEIERFKILSDSILENEKKIQVMSQERNDLFKIILEEYPKLFEDALYEWAKSNPIEAISYIYAGETFTDEIYHDNGTGYEILFERDINEDNIYTLYDKKTLSGYTFSESKIKEYYSSFKNTSNMYLTLDFLNSYKVNIIKDEGYFNNQSYWITDIKVVEDMIPIKDVLKFLDKNFTLAVSSSEDESNNITFSKEGIVEFSDSFPSELFENLSKEEAAEDVYVILNNNTPVGLIELSTSGESQTISLEKIEFPKENQRLGYGTHTIEMLQSIFPDYTIEGYSGEEDYRHAFYISLGAEYLDCSDCLDIHECDSYYLNTGEPYGCDKPYDHRFIIRDCNR